MQCATQPTARQRPRPDAENFGGDARHISFKAAQNLGLNVTSLETDQTLQGAVLSVHHAAILTLDKTPAIKIIENDRGVAFINTMQQQLIIPGP
jgi:hypothetical protein